MALKDQLQEDMKSAMKGHDKDRLSVIRMLKGALQNEEIDKGHDLSKEEELSVLSRELKQRRDSAQEYREAGRDDLADQSEAEMKIVEEYLPEQLSDEEIEARVKEVIDEVGATSTADLGKVMGKAIADMKGQADGAKIQQIAKSLLSSK